MWDESKEVAGSADPGQFPIYAVGDVRPSNFSVNRFIIAQNVRIKPGNYELT
jgi:hypothetical protein